MRFHSTGVILLTVWIQAIICQQQPQNNDQFNFFVVIKNLPATSSNIEVPQYQASASANVQLFWNWDTCAPSPFRAPLCGWSVTPTPGQVFPNGFRTFELRKSFPGNPRFAVTNLLAGQNATAVLEQGATALGGYTIADLSRFQTDYYTIFMTALDANGKLTQGQSAYFIIKNTEPVPPLNPVQIVTPQPNSIWLAERQEPYLIRWSFLGVGIYPDLFSILLLNEKNQTVAEVYPPSRSFFLDTQFGQETNATNWVIPSFLSNGRYRLRWEGFVNTASGTLGGMEAISGIFNIGPSVNAKSNTRKLNASHRVVPHLSFVVSLLVVSISVLLF